MKEGDIRKQVAKRRDCEVCGELAAKRLTFLLPHSRSNPSSTGYGKDDISWCSDSEVFVCDEHETDAREIGRNRGVEYCSTFFYERFPHVFLYWVEIKEEMRET